MFEIPWETVEMHQYIDADLGDQQFLDCKSSDKKHGVTRHELVGKRLQQDGEQMRCQLQFCCHRCAQSALDGLTKEAFLEMMKQANKRMRQGG